MVFATAKILTRAAVAGLHHSFWTKGMQNVPLSATDHSHHREHHSDSQPKVHIEYHHRQPGYNPNHLHKHRNTIT